MAEALRIAGYKVIASDIMTYAAHHARVRLQLDAAPDFAGLQFGSYFKVLEHLQSLPTRHGHFFNEYSPKGVPAAQVPARMYFAPENAGKIDAINQRINEWHIGGKLSTLENALLRHDLILAANRVANIAGTYGHYRSKWSNGSLAPLRLEPTPFVWGYRTDHDVLQGRAEDIAHQIKADVCYIDPPYMKRQYAANYHIIETLARGDEPEAVGMSGLRPWRDQYSNFCTKTKIFASFQKIISEMQCNTFVISYSEDGLLGHDSMRAILQEFGEVSRQDIEFNRFRSNNSSLGRRLVEYVFILHKMVGSTTRPSLPKRSLSSPHASHAK